MKTKISAHTTQFLCLVVCLVLILSSISRGVDEHKANEMVSLTIDASAMDAWGDGNVSYPDNLMANHKADYVIIAPEPFYNSDALRRLANWRAQYSGLDVVVASTTRIYDNFSGVLDESIRSFIQHVYDSWDAGHISDGHVGYILMAHWRRDGRLKPVMK